VVCDINAHQSPLAVLAWSADGTLASTVSRVYSTMPGANKVGAMLDFTFQDVPFQRVPLASHSSCHGETTK
jgi:hypothetical protein